MSNLYCEKCGLERVDGICQSCAKQPMWQKYHIGWKQSQKSKVERIKQSATKFFNFI